MPVVLIALGSNVGDRLAHLQSAVSLLRESVNLVAISRVYETAPMYVTDQPPFLNAAAKAETGLPPRALLAVLKRIESRVGRTDGERYGPREVDLDLVAYGALAYRYEEGKQTRLIVPHPRLRERRFVLQPLDDVASDFRLPGMGVVHELLEQTEDQAASVTRSEDALLSI